MATPADPAATKLPRRKRAADPAKPVRSGRFAAGLALVFASIALLASGYMGWLINSKRGLTDAKGRLFQVENETARLHELSIQMDQELTALRAAQGTLSEGLKSLHDEIGKGRRAWLVAESENLLVIAQHRLDYARDTRLALEALRAADRQLAQLGDPAYQPVRKQIAADMDALEAHERLDLGGLAQRLGRLAGQAGKLPLAPEALPTPAATGAEPDFLREVWHDLKNLVRIRSTTDIRRPFLLPEQKYYVRENLRLMLLGAQVALLHGDGATFALNAGAARQWLRDYYDGDTPGVQEALAGLEAALKLRPTALPDLNAALRALREVRAQQGAS